ncbi:helix-turn-helix domain-containing protein [Anaeromyxobacter paludicola]|uniref:helix-turn-helix domain-containing protein n=1 Tax=Anaeromyxobacter paludicola TaxID=2918171 RepID=UPI0020BEF23A|nr:response regulator transcription factor [Anaeromyxobacter paludicola]
MPLPVALVGPDPLSLGGLAALLAARPELSLVAQLAPEQASPGALASAGAAAAVVDPGLPARFEALRAVAAALPAIALVSSEAEAPGALAAGARGVVRRDAGPARLAAALLAAAEGLLVLDAPLSDRLLRPPPALADPEPLTPREREVLALLGEGLANKSIAQRLGVSERTAKFHVEAILTKLGAESRAEAIVRAARQGWLVL